MSNKENGYLSDTPTEYTSSIGAVTWPPEKASFERKKGFYPEVIEDSNLLTQLLEEFSQFPFEEDVTRYSVRAIITQDALLKFIQENKDNLDLTQFFETFIPLAGCGVEELEDCVLVYIGKNYQSRISEEEIIEEQLSRAKAIFSEKIQPKKQSKKEVFTVKKLNINDLTDELIKQYYNLYSIFGWSEYQILAMLQSPNNIIVYAQNEKGQLVSSVIGEKQEIKITRNGQNITLSLVEITEAATIPNFRGNGLYQEISDSLLYYLATLDPPPNLVFGESNLESPGVLKVAHRQGRTVAFQTAQELGIPHAWFLPQHVTISQGLNKQRQFPYYDNYNNLMPTWLTQHFLLQNYGQK